MVDHFRDGFETDVLPIRQRIVWIAAIWCVSAAITIGFAWLAALAVLD